ncbi:hypothetical protein COT44_03240 [Candidatus Shapirobacteria bacterium CG08_land_8_20_14_0_20_39_18]|uniref:PIN domain-containing protein n=1 Tax=Candidatus Shapirobacteria bacterium CG08_land_8_20_14_0_20_39_18 TaxID=1974883 RepID=A0A2M6XCM9_9BACT|nr:MAG: hypothetical protein COT44_03240 [Candidatus Shapirobacteria bacterium CG08_land_8_20_14_0_20_39_18]PIY65074.1 MAG: hypothetical protein COY91_03350 [Candidatus Shapirobacteria bacterium CG_4_10_14_0_8_um_filter_39_15]
MTKIVLVDTDALFALNSQDDAHFPKALKISEKLNRQGFNFTISKFVLAETVTLLSYRISHQKAVDFLEKLMAGKFPVIKVTEEIENLAYQIFKNQSSKNVSLVDCLNMAILKKYRTETIFSFDKIYQKNGFKLIEV